MLPWLKSKGHVDYAKPGCYILGDSFFISFRSSKGRFDPQEYIFYISGEKGMAIYDYKKKS